MQPRKRRFSISYVLVPVCLVITAIYMVMVGPELWKDDPTHISHAAQQFNMKMKEASQAAVQAEVDGDYELAFRLYREAIQIRPKNSRAHNDFGGVLMNAAEAQVEPPVVDGKKQERIQAYDLTEFVDYPIPALDHIKTTLRAVPSEKSGMFRFEVYKNVRDLVHDQMEIWNKDSIRAIMSSHPLRTDNDGATIYSVFLIYGKAASYVTSAERRFRRAIELTPEYALAYRNLGAVFMLLQRPADSKLALRQALRLNPKDREVQNYLNRF